MANEAAEVVDLARVWDLGVGGWLSPKVLSWLVPGYPDFSLAVTLYNWQEDNTFVLQLRGTGRRWRLTVVPWYNLYVAVCTEAERVRQEQRAFQQEARFLNCNSDSDDEHYTDGPFEGNPVAFSTDDQGRRLLDPELFLTAWWLRGTGRGWRYR